MAELKQVTTLEAPKGSITKRDWKKGLIMAILAPINTGLIALGLNIINVIKGGEAIPLPSVKIQLLIIALTAFISGLSYIQKQFGTNSQDEFLKKEPV